MIDSQQPRTGMEPEMRVGIVGGGMAGLSAATTLASEGIVVDVFDKGRGPGGRASTRRVDKADRSVTFDHGAQYFTVRDDRFAKVVERWISGGACAPWVGQIATLDTEGELQAKPEGPTRLVGTPRMNAIVSELAQSLPMNAKVAFSTRVERVDRSSRGWAVEGAEDALGDYDALIVTAPSPQSYELLRGKSDLAERAQEFTMQPCWAVMAAFDEPLPIEADGVFVNVPGNPLSWLARDSSKPGRPPGERWMMHADPEWSQKHVEDERPSVQTALLRAMEQALQLQLPDAAYVAAHRRRYAQTSSAVDDGAAIDQLQNLAIAGDWCNGGRVEGAFLSGCIAADLVLKNLRGC
mgnify:CR=1 FL=1